MKDLVKRHHRVTISCPITSLRPPFSTICTHPVINHIYQLKCHQLSQQKSNIAFYYKAGLTSHIPWVPPHTHLRIGLWRVAGHGVAVAIHQEFGEIPLDEVAKHPTLFGLQEVPKRMSIIAIHLYFGKHVKFHPVPLGKLLDLRLSPRFLCLTKVK